VHLRAVVLVEDSSMSRLPFMQFYPADWIQDTRALSLHARGLWIDLICALWVAPERGKIVWTFEAVENFTGRDEMESAAILSELHDTGVADVKFDYVKRYVTLMSRRMMREESVRNQTRKRVERFRNAGVTQKKRRILQKSEVRSHISEEDKSAKAPLVLPDWIPKKEWGEFAAVRKRKRAPLTDNIAVRIIAVLDKLRGAGHDPAEVLAQAVNRNWTSIEFDWVHKVGQIGSTVNNRQAMPQPKRIEPLGERPDANKIQEGLELLRNLTSKMSTGGKP
jgi:hypothetical protein